MEVVVVGEDEHAPRDRVDPHVLRERKTLYVINPQSSGGHTGERGAARAALEAWVREQKGQDLARVRDYLARLEVGGSFGLDELPQKIGGAKVHLVERDLESLVEHFMASLGLSFEPPNRYRKTRVYGGRPGTPVTSGPAAG